VIESLILFYGTVRKWFKQSWSLCKVFVIGKMIEMWSFCNEGEDNEICRVRASFAGGLYSILLKMIFLFIRKCFIYVCCYYCSPCWLLQKFQS